MVVVILASVRHSISVCAAYHHERCGPARARPWVLKDLVCLCSQTQELIDIIQYKDDLNEWIYLDFKVQDDDPLTMTGVFID